MREHFDELREQARRLEELLAALDNSHSTVRDTKVSIAGNVAALMDTPLQTRSSRTHWLEHFKSRLTSRFSLLPSYRDLKADNLLRQSLREEEAMAEWIDSQIPTSLPPPKRWGHFCKPVRQPDVDSAHDTILPGRYFFSQYGERHA